MVKPYIDFNTRKIIAAEKMDAKMKKSCTY